MKAFLDNTRGVKTYIGVVTAIAYAIWQMWNGNLDLDGAIGWFIAAWTAGSLRHAITTEAK